MSEFIFQAITFLAGFVAGLSMLFFMMWRDGFWRGGKQP